MKRLWPILALLAACSVDNIEPRQDAALAQGDAGAVSDASAAADAASDASSRDGATPDASPRDAGQSDASADAGRSCDDIATDYLAYRNLARSCDASSLTPCAVLARDHIGCTCTVYVSGAYASQMVALEREWDGRSCHAICPLVACRIPTAATCSAGMCEQNFP